MATPPPMSPVKELKDLTDEIEQIRIKLNEFWINYPQDPQVVNTALYHAVDCVQTAHASMEIATTLMVKGVPEPKQKRGTKKRKK